MKLRGSTLISSLLFMLLPHLPMAYASERRVTLVGVYSQSNVILEQDTNSPYYVGNNSNIDSSYNLGVLIESPLTQRWGLETGIIFLQRGYQIPASSTSNNNDIYRWKNFFIPIVGRFHPTNTLTGSIGLYVAQGSGDISHQQTNSQSAATYKSFRSSGYHSFDWGMSYSAGLTVDINNNSSLLVEVRFNESLTNFVDTKLPNVGAGEKATIHETQLVIGFAI